MANNKFTLQEVGGDLFSASEDYSLAHCVTADFYVECGIGVKFKKLYGQVDKLLAQGAEPGGVAMLQDNDRYIYFLVTKPKWEDHATYATLRSSLIAMREHMRYRRVRKLAIPRIACSCDNLDWIKVTEELYNVFGNENLEIAVYNYMPN